MGIHPGVPVSVGQLPKTRTDKLTIEELDALKACQNQQQWNKLCDAIKAIRGGSYPDDWFVVLNFSGLMKQIMDRWNAPPKKPRPIRKSKYTPTKD